MLKPGQIEFEDRTMFQYYRASLKFEARHSYEAGSDLSFEEFQQIAKADIYHELYGDLEQEIRYLRAYFGPAAIEGIQIGISGIRQIDAILAKMEAAKGTK